MSSALSFCDSCLQAEAAWCENIAFATGLTANTHYIVEITNHFGQVYTQTVITSSNGNITVDISKFPDQFFNPYSGIYTLVVKTMANVEVDIINGYEPWPCISFDIYEKNDAN